MLGSTPRFEYRGALIIMTCRRLAPVSASHNNYSATFTIDLGPASEEATEQAFATSDAAVAHA